MQNIFSNNTIKCIFFTSLIRYYLYVDDFSDNFSKREKCDRAVVCGMAEEGGGKADGRGKDTQYF